jgi:hypothetical protein
MKRVDLTPMTRVLPASSARVVGCNPLLLTAGQDALRLYHGGAALTLSLGQRGSA